MTGAEPYKLPEIIAKELEDAAKVTHYDNMARAQMKAIGIPDKMVGNVPGTRGQASGAFSPNATSGGTHTPPLVEGTYTPRINVDAAVLDANNPFMTRMSPSWRTASVEARMQAVAAHEYAEALIHNAGRQGSYPQAVLDAIRVARDTNASPTAAQQALRTIHDYGHIGAILRAPDAPLKLSPEAKQILTEYRKTVGLEPK
jgi:hypothetical protein